MKFIYCCISNLFLIIKKMFGCKVYYCPFSMISPYTSLRTYGKGTIRLGKKNYIRSVSEISARNGKIIIGDNCFINRNCMIVSHGSILIDEGTIIGPGVYIYDHNHLRKGGFDIGKIEIGKKVWIGANSVILKDVRIGDNAIIGAGSVVTHDIDANSLFYQKREEKSNTISL